VQLYRQRFVFIGLWIGAFTSITANAADTYPVRPGDTGVIEYVLSNAQDSAGPLDDVQIQLTTSAPAFIVTGRMRKP